MRVHLKARGRWDPHTSAPSFENGGLEAHQSLKTNAEHTLACQAIPPVGKGGLPACLPPTKIGYWELLERATQPRLQAGGRRTCFRASAPGVQGATGDG